MRRADQGERRAASRPPTSPQPSDLPEPDVIAGHVRVVGDAPGGNLPACLAVSAASRAEVRAWWRRFVLLRGLLIHWLPPSMSTVCGARHRQLRVYAERAASTRGPPSRRGPGSGPLGRQPVVAAGHPEDVVGIVELRPAARAERGDPGPGPDGPDRRRGPAQEPSEDGRLHEAKVVHRGQTYRGGAAPGAARRSACPGATDRALSVRGTSAHDAPDLHASCAPAHRAHATLVREVLAAGRARRFRVPRGTAST